VERQGRGRPGQGDRDRVTGRFCLCPLPFSLLSFPSCLLSFPPCPLALRPAAVTPRHGQGLQGRPRQAGSKGQGRHGRPRVGGQRRTGSPGPAARAGQARTGSPRTGSPRPAGVVGLASCPCPAATVLAVRRPSPGRSPSVTAPEARRGRVQGTTACPRRFSRHGYRAGVRRDKRYRVTYISTMITLRFYVRQPAGAVVCIIFISTSLTF